VSDLELTVAAKDTDRPKLTLGRRLWSAVLPVALAVLLLGFAAVDRGVLSPANLLNITQQTSYLALFAMAQTVVILTRGFDLALGPTVSMVSVGSALAMAGATASGHGAGGRYKACRHRSRRSSTAAASSACRRQL
jgi:ribose transport system permease protein